MATHNLITIPVQPSGPQGSQVSHFRCTVQLSGRRWFFAFYTSKQSENGYGEDSQGCWFMDISPDTGPPGAAAGVQGIPMGLGLDMLYPYRHLDLPPGMLWVKEHAPQLGVDPGVDGFSSGHFSLVYLEEIEEAA